MKSTVEQIKEKFSGMSAKKPAKQMILLSREEFECFIDEISPAPTNIPKGEFKPFAVYKDFWFYMTRDILESKKMSIAFFFTNPVEVDEFLTNKYPDIDLDEAILVRAVW